MPSEEIVEMRTPIHGITIEQLEGKQSDAQLKSKIAKILKNKKLVGHSVDKDLAVLEIDHSLVRDTAYKFSWTICPKSPSLKNLAKAKLGVEIQKGEHDSYEDTLAALMIYVRKNHKKSFS
jgi:RNA exonuclease 4